MAKAGRISNDVEPPIPDVPEMANGPLPPEMPLTGVVDGGLLIPPAQHPPPFVVVGATA